MTLNSSSPDLSRMRRGKSFLFLSITGFVLLILWALWWGMGLSVQIPVMLYGLKMWVPAYPFIGLDFINNYAGARELMSGGDPYRQIVGDPLFPHYNYAPPVLILFSWCSLLPPDIHLALAPRLVIIGGSGVLHISRTAVIIWTIAIAVFNGIATYYVWRFRCTLKISQLPFVFMLAAVLFSLPVLFEMERGNCNVLTLILLVAGILCIDKKRRWTLDILAGLCLAFAFWVKPYVLFALIALFAAKKNRVIPITIGWILLLALLWWRQVLVFSTNLSNASHNLEYEVMPYLHPIMMIWPKLMQGTLVVHVPPKIAGFVLIVLPTLFVMYKLWRSPKGHLMLLPAALWCTAAGTYLPPVSYDYNYVFYVLAVLALWDKKDPFWVHAFLGFMLLWWQPFDVPFSYHTIFWVKLASLYAVGYLLIVRCRELESLPESLPDVTQSSAAGAS